MSEKGKKIKNDGEEVIKVSTLVYAFLIVVVISFGVVSILAYATNTQIGIKIRSRIAKIVPFPAAIVDWRHIVFENELQSNLASVQKFYSTQNFASEGLRIDFTTESGKKRLKIKEREVLDKMVEDQIIQILAKKKGVSVSDEDVEKVVSQKLNEFGTEDDVKKDLEKSYGWRMEDFKEKIVKPSLYTQALEAKILADDKDRDQAKQTISKAQKELENGKDFVEVVRMYSQGTSKERDGELGWVKKEQVLPELQEKLFGQSTFKKNDIIESSIGYHLVDVKDFKKEDGVDFVQLRQIFVSKNTFADWLEIQKKEFDVSLPSSDFVWNKEKGAVDFGDQSMREFEKVNRAKAEGDASIMF